MAFENKQGELSEDASSGRGMIPSVSSLDAEPRRKSLPLNSTLYHRIQEETVPGTFSLSTTWMLEKTAFWNDSQTCDHEDKPSLGGGAAIFIRTIVQF